MTPRDIPPSERQPRMEQSWKARHPSRLQTFGFGFAEIDELVRPTEFLWIGVDSRGVAPRAKSLSRARLQRGARMSCTVGHLELTTVSKLSIRSLVLRASHGVLGLM